MKLHAVILCGGRGERFWPRSRRFLPKQFLTLFGDRSLLQDTSARIAPLCPTSHQLFVASSGMAKTIRRQVRVPESAILVEPAGRNTAPAIGLAAAHLAALEPDATMVVLPADHHISRLSRFHAAVRLAARAARDGALVTFGIPPTRPDTGYGYIRVGERLAGRAALTVHRVAEFCEKPDFATAERYLKTGEFLWNSGMFVWRADAILDALRRFLPALAADLRAYTKAVGTPKQAAALGRVYRRAEPVSIDYAVMEKAKNVVALRAGFGWDDVGSWLALERHLKADRDGNSVAGLVAARAAGNCIVDSDCGLVALLGVRDLVVVRSGDAVLVAARDKLPELKRLLRRMAEDPKTREYL